MSKLFEGYFRSLKPLSVEEPIDVWVHRPLAYLLARALLPTRVSPNWVTLWSIMLGLLALLFMVRDSPGHLQWAGLCIFASAVADCADGQLARMRGTSSALGRMLDGTADLVVSIATVGGGAYVVMRAHCSSLLEASLYGAAIVASAITGSFHTASYDHYKNVYLRLTQPTHAEAEDLESARARYASRRGKSSLGAAIAWPIYLFYLKSQTDYIRSFDPYTSTQLGKLPAYSEQTAGIYAQCNQSTMRLWRTWFGFGSLTFGIALATALNLIDVYLLLRVFLLNGLYFGYMRQSQRRASQLAFNNITDAASA